MAENIYEIMAPHVPQDHCHQSTAMAELKALLSSRHDIATVLDLGCGDGRSADLFRKLAPGVKWTGVDIEDSPEVKARARRCRIRHL